MEEGLLRKKLPKLPYQTDIASFTYGEYSENNQLPQIKVHEVMVLNFSVC